MGDFIQKGEKATHNPKPSTQAILDQCERRGFTIRKNGQQNDRWSATHKQLGVKFSIDQKHYEKFRNSDITCWSVEVTVKVKSNHDTWVVPRRQNRNQLRLHWEVPEDLSIKKPATTFNDWLEPSPAAVQQILNLLPNFKGATEEERQNRNKLEDLYKPLVLTHDIIVKDQVRVDNKMLDGVKIQRVLESAVVIGFAVIQEDLWVNSDVTNPGSDSWFHLACTTENGRPHILARLNNDNKLECYPARKAGVRYRICEMNPNGTYMNFRGMTNLDAMLIEAAIEQFSEQL